MCVCVCLCVCLKVLHEALVPVGVWWVGLARSSNYTSKNTSSNCTQRILPETIVVRIKYSLYICNVRIHTDAIICSLSFFLALYTVLCACTVRVLWAWVCTCAVCLVWFVGCGCRRGLWVIPGFVSRWCGGLGAHSLQSLALLCALVDMILNLNIFLVYFTFSQHE